MNHIELFAGCGGLALGLESVGFETLLANELSPMAAETFAYNLLGEDLEGESEGESRTSSSALWLSSSYPRYKLKQRLRENPFTYPSYDLNVGFINSDLPNNPIDLKGKLLVGSIVDLNKWLGDKDSLKYVEAFKSGFGNNGVDLISGGPPCQSFSMAGMRRKDCDKNTLPFEFVKFVQIVQPKIVLLENVTGILRAFTETDPNGKKTSYLAWFEIAKFFGLSGYVPVCLHLNARMVGVAQNRPRFILVGIRKDIFDRAKCSPSLSILDDEIFEQSENFYKEVHKVGEDLNFSNELLSVHDYSKESSLSKIKDSPVFGNLFAQDLSSSVTVKDAIGDLLINSTPNEPSEYIHYINNELGPYCRNVDLDGEKQNHQKRDNSHRVKVRFRIYQIIQALGEHSESREVAKRLKSLLKGEVDTEISQKDFSLITSQDFYPLSHMEQLVIKKSIKAFKDFILEFATKKQTQKALDANAPAPAALSIPDDACHYSPEELRTLTVREMSRIQSFPDNFVFRSKVTTGGQMRKFEVPQYTQVGNAVPPLLARELGITVSKLLGLIKG
jgi:DNA (cytosine-5)-methyltransferase 1